LASCSVGEFIRWEASQYIHYSVGVVGVVRGVGGVCGSGVVGGVREWESRIIRRSGSRSIGALGVGVGVGGVGVSGGGLGV